MTTNERTIDAVAAGHICLDIIPKFPDSTPPTIGEIFRPGKVVSVETAAISTGGPVSNTGIALDILGLKVAFCAKVGGDALGEIIIDRLKQRGRAEGVSAAAGEGSSYTVALAPPNIDRIFLHDPGTNHTFSSDNVNWDLVRQARLFHFGYPPLMRGMYSNDGAALAKVLRLAKEAGATTSLDMSLPDPSSESGQANWDRILTNILPYVDVFLPSAEELFFMLDREEFLAAKEAHGGEELIDHITPDDNRRRADICLERGAAVLCIKSAHRGYYCRTASAEKIAGIGAAAPADPARWADKELWRPGFIVEKIASATGSGDSSIAGFLAAFLRDLPVEQCLRYANAVGAENLSQLDALSGIRPWEETTAMLNKPAWKTIELDLGPNWTWDADALVWRRA